MTFKQLIIPPAIMRSTLYHPEANNFLNFLKTKFAPAQINQVIKDYNIGTSTRWPGATIFWRVTIDGEIRTGKIVHYDLKTGAVTDKPYYRVSWFHDSYKPFGYEVLDCLYGENLLHDRFKNGVGLVESEKSAVIASIFMPNKIWLAIGENFNLTEQFCKHLKGRHVSLYPDVDRYKSWCKRAESIAKSIPMTVNQLLQKDSIFRNKYPFGTIADYLFENRTCVDTANISGEGGEGGA